MSKKIGVKLYQVVSIVESLTTKNVRTTPK